MGAFLYGPVHGFMLWNLFLAAIPAVLAIALFAVPMWRGGVHRRGSWWLGLGAWVLFLPNAPYVLTDVVHMVHDVRCARSDTRAYLVIATYGVLFACGLGVVRDLAAAVPPVPAPHRAAPGWSRRSWWYVHALCVLAMYLGRFMRLNSWDAVLAPQAVVASVLHVPRPSTVSCSR